MTKLDDKEIMTVRFDKEGSVIAAGLANGNVYIYNPHTGTNSVAFLSTIHSRPIVILDLSRFLWPLNFFDRKSESVLIFWKNKLCWVLVTISR